MNDPHRKRWNAGQQKLRRALSAESPEAIGLFLEQHAMVHAGKLTRNVLWSFEDEILNDMTEQQIRCLPASAGHSVAWILFHLARIEDMTMNLLVSGTPAKGYGTRCPAPCNHRDPGLLGQAHCSGAAADASDAAQLSTLE